MGNCNCNTAIDLNKKDSTNAYTFGIALGQGGFGKVWKVVHKKDKKVFAMKVMQKKKILTKKSVTSIMNEKKILSEVNNLFIINMQLAFQDKENLYLVLEYMNGGDMRYHINRGVEFTEEQTKFIACSIIYGLSAIHKNNVIHRDLKPENLVFNADGYLKITDFGIARYYTPNNAHHTSGTPGYMAPEVLLKQPHGFLVDYYALGVILFEIIYGERPYLGKNRKEIKDKIVKEQRKLTKNDLPDETWTPESADFVNKLVQRNPTNRLGFKGIEQIISHPWLSDFSWEKLATKKYKPTFKPVLIEGESGGSFVNSRQNHAEDEKDRENEMLLRRNSIQEQFDGFDYDPEGILVSQKQKKEKDLDSDDKTEIQQQPQMSVQTQMNSSQRCYQSQYNSQVGTGMSPIKRKHKQHKSMLDQSNIVNNPEELNLQKIDEEKNENNNTKQKKVKEEEKSQDYNAFVKEVDDLLLDNDNNNKNEENIKLIQQQQEMEHIQIKQYDQRLNSRSARMSRQSLLSQQQDYAQSQMREGSLGA